MKITRYPCDENGKRNGGRKTHLSLTDQPAKVSFAYDGGGIYLSDYVYDPEYYNRDTGRFGTGTRTEVYLSREEIQTILKMVQEAQKELEELNRREAQEKISRQRNLTPEG